MPWTLKAAQTPASWEPPHSPGLRLAALTAGRWATLLAASPEPAVLSLPLLPPQTSRKQRVTDGGKSDAAGKGQQLILAGMLGPGEGKEPGKVSPDSSSCKAGGGLGSGPRGWGMGAGTAAGLGLLGALGQLPAKGAGSKAWTLTAPCTYCPSSPSKGSHPQAPARETEVWGGGC